uniref:Uncharacterized protein n=1 Tax=Auxenochlorella protothecoides TaxID=3075 RepID=A0A1D2ACS9_AUXPR
MATQYLLDADPADIAADMNIPQAQQVILNSAEAWELSAHLRSRDMNVTGDELVGRLRSVAHYGRQNLSPRRMEFLPPTQLASPPSPEGIDRDTAPASTSSPTNPPPVLSPPSQQMELRAAPGSDAAGPSAASPACKTSPSQRLAGGAPHPTQTPQTHPQAERQNQAETQTLSATQVLAEPRSQDEPQSQANAGAVAEAQPQAEAGVEDEPEPQAEAQSLPEARAQTAPGALTRNRAHAAATAPVPATQPVQQVEDREDSAGEEVRMETHATQAPAAQSNMAAAAGVVQGGEEEEFSSDTSDDDTDEDSQGMVGAGWNGRALGGSDMAFTASAPLTSSRRLSRGHFLISSCSMPVPAVDAALPTPCLTFLALPLHPMHRSHHAGAHPAGQGPRRVAAPRPSISRCPVQRDSRPARALPPGRAWRRGARGRALQSAGGCPAAAQRALAPRRVGLLAAPAPLHAGGGGQPTLGPGPGDPGGGRTQPGGGGGPAGAQPRAGGGRGPGGPRRAPGLPVRAGAQGPRPGCRAALPRPRRAGCAGRGDPGARRRARHQDPAGAGAKAGAAALHPGGAPQDRGGGRRPGSRGRRSTSSQAFEEGKDIQHRRRRGGQAGLQGPAVQDGGPLHMGPSRLTGRVTLDGTQFGALVRSLTFRSRA